MNTFEYIAIAYSLLFSALALRLIGGLRFVFNPERRYWVHAAVVVIVLLATTINFWAYLGNREVEWTLLRFLAVLGVPGTLYFLASTLVPDDPALVASWETYYFEKRIPIYASVVLWGCLSAANNTFLLQMPATHPGRAVQLSIVAIGAWGLLFARPLAHKLLVGLMMLACALAVPILMQPGATAQ